WVCDLMEDRAAEAVRSHGSVRTTADLDEVLSDPEVGGIAIATPAATHAEIALRCFEAGKHVLIEKPLAISLEVGREIVRIADEQSLVLMCDHTFCYTSAVRKIREVIHSGDLGEVQFFDSVRINLGLVQSDIDVFWDLAPHDLSILDFVLPSDCAPVAVSAQASDPVGIGHACIGYLSLPLSNGSMAHVHVNWLSPTKIRTTIIGGSKKMLVWDDLSPGQRLSLFDTAVELNAGMDAKERRRALVSYRTGDMIAPALPETEALRLVVEEFAVAIQQRRRPLTDGYAGLRVLAVLTAIEKSLKADGAAIPLDRDL
ncbi:MAG: Gfo/Idh/MocA family protein, partial [Acidimicrobiia bacterium]